MLETVEPENKRKLGKLNSPNDLNTANTLLSVISANAPVGLLSVLDNISMKEESSYRSLFLRAEYILDRALNNLDSAKSKARESQALADGSNHLVSLAWKYAKDI